MTKQKILRAVLRVGEILLGLYAICYFGGIFMESFTAYLDGPLPPEEQLISQVVMKGHVTHMIIAIICIVLLEFMFHQILYNETENPIVE